MGREGEAEIIRLKAENALLKKRNAQWMRLMAENQSLKLQLLNHSSNSPPSKQGRLLKMSVNGDWSSRIVALHKNKQLSWYYSDPESESGVSIGSSVRLRHDRNNSHILDGRILRIIADDGNPVFQAASEEDAKEWSEAIKQVLSSTTPPTPTTTSQNPARYSTNAQHQMPNPSGTSTSTAPRKMMRQRPSVMQVAVESNEAKAVSLITAVSEKPHKSNPQIDSFAVEIPSDTIFVGHLNTDMDSIGSSIGAAYLFEGKACAASELNTETKFALKEWGFDEPVRFEDYKGDKSKICLMDHNQESQIAPNLDLKSIVGIIDHHALQSGTVITDRPIYVDIRPWGSACTIVGHTFLRIRKHIPPKIAGVLLSGILSDTLNLRSPTTTDHDRLLVAVLAKISHCDDIDLLADKQFAAKSEALNHLSPYEVACGDQKKFNIKDEHGEMLAIGFGVVETTDPGGMINRIDELMIEVASLKAEQSLDFSYLAIVDIVKLTSTLLLIGKSEAELAKESFGADATSPNNDGIGTMELQGMVSRKKDFVPKLSKAIGEGFKASELAIEKTKEQKEVVVEEVYGVVEKELREADHVATTANCVVLTTLTSGARGGLLHSLGPQDEKRREETRVILCVNGHSRRRLGERHGQSCRFDAKGRVI
ncbi:hypothetical protein TrST_g298 [Triparma strigata]|uniref:inorganic diphosphatase n=1 Tax=Triparma strigata TaxID=1606541 RepID=A0A9W7ASQ9_9STRA|nr:hypothetical protein TrST_g298 [Triparma strigata]